MESHFGEEVCACGKKHPNPIRKIVVEKGAVLHAAEYVRALDGSSAFVLADKNTYKAAGEAVCAAFTKGEIPFVSYVLPEEAPEPDEKTVGAAVMHFDPACDVICAVGSGVINDIGKILSYMTGKPYIIFATAPSMDGYASATSSMATDGLKVSLPTRCADMIVGDVDILCKAPLRLLTAGLGDILAKYISICEWRIANRITGEYYCEAIADLVRSAVRKCAENAEGLVRREEEAVKAVFEGLILSGVAMAYAGVSRPASGVEHYFSHIWDMRGLAKGTPVDLHGTQCAVGTLLAARLYETLKGMRPDKEKASQYVAAFDYHAWSEVLRELLGKGAEAMIRLEEKENKYDSMAHKARLDVILEAWDDILKIIDEEIPTPSKIESILEKIGAPKSLAEIGQDPSLFPVTFKATRDIRDKYVLSRLAWDLGITEELLEKGNTI